MRNCLSRGDRINCIEVCSTHSARSEYYNLRKVGRGQSGFNIIMTAKGLRDSLVSNEIHISNVSLTGNKSISLLESKRVPVINISDKSYQGVYSDDARISMHMYKGIHSIRLKVERWFGKIFKELQLIVGDDTKTSKKDRTFTDFYCTHCFVASESKEIKYLVFRFLINTNNIVTILPESFVDDGVMKVIDSLSGPKKKSECKLGTWVDIAVSVVDTNTGLQIAGNTVRFTRRAALAHAPNTLVSGINISFDIQGINEENPFIRSSGDEIIKCILQGLKIAKEASKDMDLRILSD